MIFLRMPELGCSQAPGAYMEVWSRQFSMWSWAFGVSHKEIWKWRVASSIRELGGEVLVEKGIPEGTCSREGGRVHVWGGYTGGHHLRGTGRTEGSRKLRMPRMRTMATGKYEHLGWKGRIKPWKIQNSRGQITLRESKAQNWRRGFRRGERRY